MKKINKTDRAKLQDILAALPGVVVQDDGTVIGTASNGTVVQLGNYTYAPVQLLNYLRAYPTPSDW